MKRFHLRIIITDFLHLVNGFHLSFTKMFMNQLAIANQDRYTKKLTTLDYLKLFIHAQLQQREGLRAISVDVCSETFQNEL